MIQVMVKVPTGLSGASLLAVHNWVKGSIARTNPGASPDYTITDSAGSRLTLSDVARSAGKDINIEVTTISAVRNNPPTSLTMIPGMEKEYTEMTRTGNSLTELLPNEIDSAMATRVIAEQGLHRGLHTLNRMTLEVNNKHISSPTTAALLQMGEMIKKNPSDRTLFTQRTPVHYGSEKALQTWLTEASGADDISIANTDVENAKIAAKYGLNTQDITKFSQEVLSDYLFAASSNRGLIRTLIRNLPELTDNNRASASRETIQKLIYMFPTQPRSFYEGSQRVFVANPAFMYPAYAEGILSLSQMQTIVRFAQNYPRNMGRLDTVPRALRSITRTGRARIYHNWRRWLHQTVTRGRGVADHTNVLDAEYSREGHLQTVVAALTQDPRDALREIDFRPISYYSDMGGFYPSPPEKWPRKLMYAIMDGFLVNLPHIVNMEDPTQTNLTPVQMAYFTQMNKPAKSKKSDKKPKAKDKIKVQTLVGGSEVTLTRTEADNILKLSTITEDDSEGLAEFFKHAAVLKIIKGLPDIEGNPALLERYLEIVSNVTDALATHDTAPEVDHKSGDKEYMLYDKTELSFDAAGPKSIVEMVYDIAEIATNKYDYNMRGDDFKFTMSVVHYAFNSMAESTHGSMFDLTTSRIQSTLSNILGLDRFNRLDSLSERIFTSGLEEAPRTAATTSAHVSMLYLARDEFRAQINTSETIEQKEATREMLRGELRELHEAYALYVRGPAANAQIQEILSEIRRNIEE